MTRTLLIMLAVLAVLAGCAAPRDMRHGVLVDDWYEGLAGSPPPRHPWDPMIHMCRYADGVVINVGRSPCP